MPQLREHGHIKKGATKDLKGNRFCISCLNGEVEDEVHFTLKCPLYDNLRTPLPWLAT